MTREMERKEKLRTGKGFWGEGIEFSWDEGILLR